MSQEHLRGGFQSDRRHNQPGPVEQEALFQGRPVMNMAAQEIPFLLGGAQGQPGQAAELLHKKWDIKIGPRLLNEAR